MGRRLQLPDSEVTARPKRRRFTAEYKPLIVDEADAAQDAGAVGGLLRREGPYSSHLSTWRRQRRQGELEALAPKRPTTFTSHRSTRRITYPHLAAVTARQAGAGLGDSPVRSARTDGLGLLT
jgi:transposase-like protein